MSAVVVTAATLLKAEADRFDGLLIDESALPSDAAEFEQALTFSLASWQAAGKRGIWLKLPKARCALIPVALTRGFALHHCQQDYVMLTTWLQTSVASTLPEYATHTIGAGGFVVREDTPEPEVLVVQEKYGGLVGKNAWKLPGGYTNAGEELGDAAMREVMEECGVKTAVLGVVCMRHTFPGIFARSDIYVVVRLRPLSFDICTQESEIAQARWMPLSEFIADPDVNDTNKEIARLVQAQEIAARQGKPRGLLEAKHLPLYVNYPGRSFVTLWSAPPPQ